MKTGVDFLKKLSSADFRKVTGIALTAGLILFAFVHSMMPGDVSSQESNSFLAFLENFFRLFGVSTELSGFLVRKAAHFTEYAAIGVSSMFCAKAFNDEKPLKYIFQVLFTGLASAVTDETIQLNVEGRAGQVTDVLIDFSGFLTGAALFLAVTSLILSVRKRKDKKS